MQSLDKVHKMLEVNLFLFSIPDGSLKRFENSAVKLSAKETNGLH